MFFSGLDSEILRDWVGHVLTSHSPIPQHGAWLRVGFKNELIVKMIIQRYYMILIHPKKVSVLVSATFIKVSGNITIGETIRKHHYTEVKVPEGSGCLMFSGIFLD